MKVVAAVVKTLASNLGITVPSDAKPSTLNTEQVNQSINQQIYFTFIESTN